MMNKAKIILVDHFKSTHEKIKKEQIVAVFDHHIDYTEKENEGKVPDIGEYLRIEKVGSSATVISQFVLKTVHKRSVYKLSRNDQAVLRLLHGPIFLDTRNLQDDKVTEDLDRDMIRGIEDQLQTKKEDRDEMFINLCRELDNIEGLDGVEVLRKDAKITEIVISGTEKIRVAIPSIPITPHVNDNAANKHHMKSLINVLLSIFTGISGTVCRW